MVYIVYRVGKGDAFERGAVSEGPGIDAIDGVRYGEVLESVAIPEGLVPDDFHRLPEMDVG